MMKQYINSFSARIDQQLPSFVQGMTPTIGMIAPDG